MLLLLLLCSCLLFVHCEITAYDSDNSLIIILSYTARDSAVAEPGRQTEFGAFCCKIWVSRNAFMSLH